MTTEITGNEITENERRQAAEPPAGLAEQLVAAARTQGLALTGPGGLLTGLTKQVLQTALEVEMSEHLGHDRGERSASGNLPRSPERYNSGLTRIPRGIWTWDPDLRYDA